MAKKFIPCWKDDSGNRIFFTGKDLLFDEDHEAAQHQLGNFMFMVPFGLNMAGRVECEVDENGHGQIEHVEVHAGRLGTAYCISGPLFDEVSQKQRKAENVS